MGSKRPARAPVSDDFAEVAGGEPALAVHALFEDRQALDLPLRQREIGEPEERAAEHAARDTRPAAGRIQVQHVRVFVRKTMRSQSSVFPRNDSPSGGLAVISIRFYGSTVVRPFGSSS